jgi:hypothetical protein
MKASLKTIEQLQKRLKSIENSASPNEMEELLNATSAASKLETTDDILEFSNAKLEEIETCGNQRITDVHEFGEEKISELGNVFDSDLSEFTSQNQDSIDELSELSTEKLEELGSIFNDLATINNVPEGTTITETAISHFEANKFLNTGNLPFLFGILSRYDDYYEIGTITSTFGQWYSSGADYMLQFLAGCHNYTTQYAGFYLEPKLCFFQGVHGNFNKKKSYVKYQNTTSQYQYPYAAIGCLFVKNPTEEAITATISFGGSSYWSSGYEGSSMFVGTPNSETEALTWTNVFSYSTSTASFSNTANITVPALKTVCVLFYTSSYYFAAPSSKAYHAQFLEWRLTNIRSGFLSSGLEIDFETTLKAWQCPGFNKTFELFK